MPTVFCAPPENGEIVEIPILIPEWQLRLLESAASDSGRTTGQMLRSLISEFCSRRQGLEVEEWQEE
jgi:hypothetical protein